MILKEFSTEETEEFIGKYNYIVSNYSNMVKVYMDYFESLYLKYLSNLSLNPEYSTCFFFIKIKKSPISFIEFMSEQWEDKYISIQGFEYFSVKDDEKYVLRIAGFGSRHYHDTKAMHNYFAITYYAKLHEFSSKIEVLMKYAKKPLIIEESDIPFIKYIEEMYNLVYKNLERESE